MKRIIGRSDDQERQKIAEWISSTNYATYQADFLSQRQEGTGQWLLNTTEFCEWVKEVGVLYCPGIPGAGKTILSSIIINYLQESFGMEQDIGIAYIFCNYRQQHEQKLVDIRKHFEAADSDIMFSSTGFECTVQRLSTSSITPAAAPTFKIVSYSR